MRPATLGHLRRRSVDVFAWCDECGHNATLPIGPLIERFGPTLPVRRLSPFLKCTDCGRRAAEARPAPGDHGVMTNHQRSDR